MFVLVTEVYNTNVSTVKECVVSRSYKTKKFFFKADGMYKDTKSPDVILLSSHTGITILKKDSSRRSSMYLAYL